MSTETQAPAAAPKPKKSVALSGVVAGNTALCTVGRSGNDLHYRGYDILETAVASQFEEIAHLLIHGHLPTTSELAAYKTKLKALRGLPLVVRDVLESLPAASHPMDVMRSGVSALGCALSTARPRYCRASPSRRAAATPPVIRACSWRRPKALSASPATWCPWPRTPSRSAP